MPNALCGACGKSHRADAFARSRRVMPGQLESMGAFFGRPELQLEALLCDRSYDRWRNHAGWTKSMQPRERGITQVGESWDGTDMGPSTQQVWSRA